MIKRIISKKVGELLIERGIVTPEQLSEALERQKQFGGYVSQHLIALKYVSESDIAVCLSNQYNFAYLPLKHYSIGKDVLGLIPLKWVMIYTLIPVDRIGRALSVAMADPLNEGIIRMLEQLTNCEIQVFISTYSEIKEAINQYYSEELQKVKEIPLPDISRIIIAERDIQTLGYSGIERRKYLRLNLKLAMDYVVHAMELKSETVNVSFTGICFNSKVAVSVDTDINCKLYLTDGEYLESVIRIVRVQNKDDHGPYPYEIAGVIEFMSNEDKVRLADLLKASIPS